MKVALCPALRHDGKVGVGGGQQQRGTTKKIPYPPCYITHAYACPFKKWPAVCFTYSELVRYLRLPSDPSDRSEDRAFDTPKLK